MNLDALPLWKRLSRLPRGKQIFSAGVCLRAPYFHTVSPTFQEVEPGRVVVSIPNRRRVHNHIGTVHAIACCNAAELAAGIMVEVSVPSSHRWIPVGMTVRYLQKATTNLRAIAESPVPAFADDPAEWTVPVRILDRDDVEVVHADITMHVAPKPSKSA